MTRSKDEQAAAERFLDRYGSAPSDATVDLERTVIGGDFGANGYTTIAQADLIAERLHARAGDRLLDIGSGRGWPGLYLAKGTDCSVVLTDLPEEGLPDGEAASGRRGCRWSGDRGRGERPTSPVRGRDVRRHSHTDVLC